jgi:hypothetical protein
MKPSQNSNKSSVNKNPRLKCRYAMGVGDLIACILHSKYIGILTHFITGKKEPCEMCSARAEAFNILLPIPFWKLFFTSESELIKSLSQELKNAGYEVETSPDGKGVSSFKVTETPNQELENLNTINNPAKNFFTNDYFEIGSTDNYIGEFLIKTIIYKQNGNTNSQNTE